MVAGHLGQSKLGVIRCFIQARNMFTAAEQILTPRPAFIRSELKSSAILVVGTHIPSAFYIAAESAIQGVDISYRILKGRTADEGINRANATSRLFEAHLSNAHASNVFRDNMRSDVACWDPFSNHLHTKHEIDAAFVQGLCRIPHRPPKQLLSFPLSKPIRVVGSIDFVIKCRGMAAIGAGKVGLTSSDELMLEPWYPRSFSVFW